MMFSSLSSQGQLKYIGMTAYCGEIKGVKFGHWGFIETVIVKTKKKQKFEYTVYAVWNAITVSNQCSLNIMVLFSCKGSISFIIS